MNSRFLITTVLALGSTLVAIADDKPSDAKPKEVTKATFLITGLH